MSLNVLVLCGVMMGAYLLAYHTYGRFLARHIFKLDPGAVCPSQAFADKHDFVPTNKHILFGHHFTSIAGLGPIVGPAIAIIWGWLPAVLWVLLGSILMGAVHDFGSLVVSLRHQGRSIGDLTADLINPRVRTLFLVIMFFLLLLVISVFVMIMAKLYMAYPAAVIPVWFEIPIAIVLGLLVYRKGLNALWPSIIAVIIMYITVYIGVKIPVDFQALFPLKPTTILIIWIVIIFVLQSWLASSLPVWLLLQPRDFINSHQLIIAMALLGLGVLVAHPVVVAQPIEPSPVGAPPIWPFLFIIVACGAISGFHSLVSSGTSSKQCRTEKDSLFIGYGSMLMEATLATLVIAAVAAGIGMGLETSDGQMLTGVAAFRHHYTDWAAADGLSAKLNAFVTGASNMICAIRVGDYTIERSFAMTVMAVFIVSFAGTTVDTATRIQRYVIVELGNALKLKFLTRRQLATVLAVLTACALAFYDRKNPGTGAMVLWPLFGCLNQLLAGLALLVVTIFLARRRINCLYTLIPMIFMIFMTGWAMIAKIGDFHSKGNTLLLTIAIIVFVLEIWMIIEGALVFRQVYLSRKSA